MCVNCSKSLLHCGVTFMNSQRKEKWHRTEYFSHNKRLKCPGAWLLFSQWQAITSVGVYIAWCCHVTQCKNRLVHKRYYESAQQVTPNAFLLYETAVEELKPISKQTTKTEFLNIICWEFYVKGLKVALEALSFCLKMRWSERPCRARQRNWCN